jgi:CheY-like chemotaxis protein/tetratricopeptide (TPR) repeat protein
MLSVLLIDDDPALLEMLKLIADRSSEITMLTAQSGQEGLNVLKKGLVDVIIVDDVMAGITGNGFIQMLRREGNTTPSIIFSEDGSEHAELLALKNGADFYLKKERDPRRQFQEITALVKKAQGESFASRSAATNRRVVGDLINFSSDPGFAIDRSGVVIAWNDSMEQLTDVTADTIIGRGDFAYAEPFFGKRRQMLVDLMFESEEEIRKAKYMIIGRLKNGSLIAVTRGRKKNGSEWTIWTKAMPVYDSSGTFVAAIETVRDVTATFSDVIIPEAVTEDLAPGLPDAPAMPTMKKPVNRLIKKILRNASAHYREGIFLSVREKKYKEAIAAFDRALEIDDTLAYVWNERGICCRETGDYTTALKSCLRAVELSPENPEFLFSLGEILEQIGVMYMSSKYLESAIQTFRMVIGQIPNNADAWMHIGRCPKETGKPDEAKFYMDRSRDIMMGNRDTPIKRTRDEYL